MELRTSKYPEEWKEVKIGDLCKTFTKQTGFDYSNHIKPTLVKRKTDKVIPFIQNKDFDGVKVNYNTDYFIPFNIANKFPMILLDERCLLISISGSIGKVGVFDNFQTAFIGGAVAVGKFNNSEYLDWVKYFFLSEFGQYALLSNMKSGSHQNLILDDIRKIKIPLPTLEEQKAIAKVLTDTDQLLQNLKMLIAKKKAIKKGAMQELLTGKKRLDGFSGEWEEKTLGEIVVFTNGKAHENSVVEYGDYIIVNSKFVSTDGRVKKYSNSCFCPVYKDDVLMVLSDVPNGKAIAKCFFVDRNNSYTLNQRICSLKSKKDNPKFLYYIINRNPYFLTFDDGVKQTNLRNEDVLSCPIYLPSNIEEQNVIVQIIADMDLEIEALENQLQKTENLKQGMMQNLLTGKVRLVKPTSKTAVKEDLSIAAERTASYKNSATKNT